VQDMPAPKFIKKGKRSSDRRMRADIIRSQMSMSSFGKDQSDAPANNGHAPGQG